MTSYYIQTNLICLILLLGLTAMLRRRKGTLPARRLAFIVMVIFAMVTCFSDIFAWTCNGKEFPGARLILETANILYFLAIVWTAFAWLNYVNIRIQSLESSSKKRMVLSSIPVLLMSALILLNPITHYMFTLDENNVYSRGPGVVLHWVVSWGYLLAATGLTLLRIRRAKTKLERKKLYPLLWFIVLPSVSAVAQMLFYGMTAMQCGITLSTVMITFGSQEEQISSDTLTGLNNRKALESFLSNRLMRQQQHFSVLMCDVDRFKSINDTYGHAKGDIALKRVASALKIACGKTGQPLFLCRYGGDEFVICGTDIADEALDDFSALLQTELDALNRDHPNDIPLSISLGRAAGVCETEDDVEKLLHLADTDMYQHKKSHTR